MQSNKVFDNNAENSYQTPPVFVYLSSLFFASLITKNDRFLIEMTDKPILDYEKSNCLVVRNMRKGKKRDIKRFVDNKKTIV